MSRRGVALVLSLFGLSVYGASLAQTGDPNLASGSPIQARATCREVVLARKPGWAFTGSFTPDGSQLLVVDALYETILRYSRSGESLGPIEEPIKSTLQNLLPISGKARGDEFIVEITDGFMVLDKNLRPAMTKRLVSSGEGWSVGGIWQWEPVGKTDIVAFVDLVLSGVDREDRKDLENNWRTGFVRFPLEHPEQAKVLKLFPINGTQNRGYFRSGYRYITSLGDAAYFLSMNQGVRLFKNEKGKRPEDVSHLLPKSLRRPVLLDWDYLEQYTDMLKQIEQEAMPVGLYGWNNTLYLLYRSPMAEGKGTRWELYGIDPTGKIMSRAEVPIRANHVTVVPGPQQWAFIEKGPVLAYGSQDISRVLLIPAERLKAPLRSSGTLCTD